VQVSKDPVVKELLRKDLAEKRATGEVVNEAELKEQLSTLRKVTEEERLEHERLRNQAIALGKSEKETHIDELTRAVMAKDFKTRVDFEAEQERRRQELRRVEEERRPQILKDIEKPKGLRKIVDCEEGLVYDGRLKKCVECPEPLIYDRSIRKCVKCDYGMLYDPRLKQCIPIPAEIPSTTAEKALDIVLERMEEEGTAQRVD
jgi:hypothetical protein